MKRLIDLVFSSLLLVPLSPVMCILAVLIWAEDRHSPLYLQPRYGKNGKKFTIYKFRTMRVLENPEERVISDLREDNRVTKVGAILRPLHLDELPQVANVWKGDMSFVGPRPIPCALPVDTYGNWELRSTVSPGMTGLAQIYCTKYTTLGNKFRYDALYIKRQSSWLDFCLVIATIWKLRSILALFLWTSFVYIVLLIPYSEKSYPVAGGIPNIDKAGHLLLWAISAIIFLWSSRGIGLKKHRRILALVYGLVLAASSEALQGLVPVRSPSLEDLTADVVGLIIGIFFYWAFKVGVGKYILGKRGKIGCLPIDK